MKLKKNRIISDIEWLVVGVITLIIVIGIFVVIPHELETYFGVPSYITSLAIWIPFGLTTIYWNKEKMFGRWIVFNKKQNTIKKKV
jgi:uncharacterized membrane protein